MIGQVIGNYRIVSELGRGGMGMVYRAEHVQLGRPAALKMLLPQLSSDPSIVQRFFNEARAASAIDHPGIVEVYDFGTAPDGSAYIVMPLLKGESLATRLEHGRLAPLDGASLIVQVLSALAAAHARGIIHRDLKPDNIFLVPNELMPGGIQAKLLDFGIAKLADDKAAGVKTQTGMMIGTPAYMSPEQCMGLPDLDHRTDIYSIGCILFHVLCGRPPFTSPHGTGMIIAAQMRDAPADPRSLDPEIPAPLAAVVLRCLEKDPKARYQTANELKNALINAGAQGTLSKPPVAAQEGYMATLAVPAAQPGSLSPQQAHAIGTAQTTASGSAAEIVARTQAKKTGKGVWIGIGALLAVAGVGVAIAVTRGGDHPAEPAAAARTETANAGTANAGTANAGTANAGTPQPEPAKPGSATPEAAKPPPPAPPPPPEHAMVPPGAPPRPEHTKPAEPPCPDGMARTVDTHGQCCWPGQAWSTAKGKCIGAPTCPPSMKTKGEQCISAPTQVATTTHQTFKLDAKAYAPGTPVTFTFPGPMSSKPNSRAWVTVIEAGKPPTAYGTWEYVADGATTATLAAPKQPGAYEARLHTDYPTKSTNVVHTVAFSVDETIAPRPAANVKYRFHVKDKSVKAGEPVEVVFGQVMDALPGERFWVTVVEPGASDDKYGKYEYVPDHARKMLFEMPKEPGDYEIRLHANYPTKATNVVHRAKIHVEP